jgi:hypothetical protein
MSLGWMGRAGDVIRRGTPELLKWALSARFGLPRPVARFGQIQRTLLAAGAQYTGRQHDDDEG